MESSLTATVHGRVREVLVSANAQVPAGKPLLQVDPLDDAPSAGEEGERAALRARRARRRRRWSGSAGPCSATTSRPTRSPVRSRRCPRRAIPTPSAGCSSSTPTCARSTARTPTGSTRQLGSPQEHLHAFLRSLDAEAEGLPERFVAHLERALAHYGVESLERTAALEHAGYRLFLARQRARTAREAVRGILAAPARARRAARRRLPRGARPARGGARAARARARRARPRGPLALLRRAGAGRRARGDLRRRWPATWPRWARRDDRAEREAHIAALVDCPQPLAPLLEPPRRRRRRRSSRR